MNTLEDRVSILETKLDQLVIVHLETLNIFTEVMKSMNKLQTTCDDIQQLTKTIQTKRKWRLF